MCLRLDECCPNSLNSVSVRLQDSYKEPLSIVSKDTVLLPLITQHTRPFIISLHIPLNICQRHCVLPRRMCASLYLTFVSWRFNFRHGCRRAHKLSWQRGSRVRLGRSHISLVLSLCALCVCWCLGLLLRGASPGAIGASSRVLSSSCVLLLVTGALARAPVTQPGQTEKKRKKGCECVYMLLKNVASYWLLISAAAITKLVSDLK